EVDLVKAHLLDDDGPEPGFERLRARNPVSKAKQNLFPDDRNLIRGNGQDRHVQRSLQRGRAAILGAGSHSQVIAPLAAGFERTGGVCIGDEELSTVVDKTEIVVPQGPTACFRESSTGRPQRGFWGQERWGMRTLPNGVHRPETLVQTTVEQLERGSRRG